MSYQPKYYLQITWNAAKHPGVGGEKKRRRCSSSLSAAAGAIVMPLTNLRCSSQSSDTLRGAAQPLLIETSATDTLLAKSTLSTCAEHFPGCQLSAECALPAPQPQTHQQRLLCRSCQFITFLLFRSHAVSKDWIARDAAQCVKVKFFIIIKRAKLNLLRWVNIGFCNLLRLGLWLFVYWLNIWFFLTISTHMNVRIYSLPVEYRTI